MNKNYKEYKRMFFLTVLLLSFSFFSMQAGDFNGYAVPAQQPPVVYDDTTVYSQLMCSAHQNNTAQIQRLLDEHGDAQAQILSETRWGTDPLGWAAYHGNREMAELLLQRGFPLRVNLEEGYSPLHTAANRGTYPVLHLLVTFPHCLQDNDLAALRQIHEDESAVVRILTHRHFRFIRSLLASKTLIVGALMTPYEAACELQATECRELLEDNSLYTRLSQIVMANYETDLEVTADE